MGYALSSLAIRTIFLREFLRAPGLHRHFALDRHGAADFNHASDQSHVAECRQSGNQAAPAQIPRCNYGRTVKVPIEPMPTAAPKQNSQENLQRLATESQNEASRELDNKSALEIARIINREDEKVAKAVRRALPEIARAIDAIADAIRKGGRLIYVGAGTSGRIAALDASEIPPTYNTDPETVQYVMAGGAKALGAASE